MSSDARIFSTASSKATVVREEGPSVATTISNSALCPLENVARRLLGFASKLPEDVEVVVERDIGDPFARDFELSTYERPVNSVR